MSLAELLIDFVPRDEYLIYGTLSREWHRLWKQRKRPTVSRAAVFLASEGLLLLSIANGYPWKKKIPWLIEHAAPPVLKVVGDWGERESVTFREKWFYDIAITTENLVKRAVAYGRLEVLEYFYERGMNFDDLRIMTGHIELSPEIIKYMNMRGHMIGPCNHRCHVFSSW